jgi:hypothetical protein
MGWRERFREDNALLFEVFGHPWVIKAYLYIAILTVGHQAMYRWLHCAGTLNCGLSFLKASIWALVWPFYWLNYATDFILLRPYG